MTKAFAQRGGLPEVVCGDVSTANATAYIIGSVLMPRS
jgi:hypothetical protein